MDLEQGRGDPSDTAHALRDSGLARRPAHDVALRAARSDTERGDTARVGRGSRLARRHAALASCAAVAIALQGCADPSEVQALRAKKASLEAERAMQQQIAADAAL